jgi:glycosyltransferase involved in cell wall biosynthesis
VTVRLLHVFSTFSVGGPQRRFVELLRMMPADWEHRVVALDGQTGAAEHVAAGTRIDLLPTPPRASPLARLAAIRRTLRAEQPDLLATYNWGAIEWLCGARAGRARAIVHHEDGFGPAELVAQKRRRVLARRALLPLVDALVVPSRVLARIAHETWRQPPARVHCLPNGVDLAHFVPGPPRPRGEVVFGAVGGLRPIKNQALAIRAFARATCRPRARLVLVGDGPDTAALRALAVELGVADRVDFPGAVTDTAPCYHGFDAFVLSSHSEQMPIALVEAMASGLPVASTDVGDVGWMVAEPNRPLVVARGDPQALAAALDRLAGDPALRRELGRTNRARAEQEFDRDVCYRRFVALYARVAGA